MCSSLKPVAKIRRKNYITKSFTFFIVVNKKNSKKIWQFQINSLNLHARNRILFIIY